MSIFPELTWYSYTSYLTADQIALVRNQTWIYSAEQIIEVPVSEYSVPNRNSSRHLNGFRKRIPHASGDDIEERDGPCPDHLKVLSCNDQTTRTKPFDNYIFDPILGDGVTIYLLDSGVDWSHNVRISSLLLHCWHD
jgi:hypothetical protein